MKHRFLLFWACLISAQILYGCDRCGCSLSGHYLNTLPQYRRHAVGMRWFYRGFSSDHHGGRFSTEHFHSVEGWGQFFPHPRLQLVGVLPVNYFYQTWEERRTLSQGIGDAVLLVNYRLWERSWGKEEAWQQQLWLGGGAKLPTGRFNTALLQQGLHPNLQPGTGSWDGLMSALYNLRYRNWGMAADALFRFNRENRIGYHYGHRLNSSVRLFYQTPKGSVRWLPTAGAAYEWADEDQNLGAQVRDTGGFCLWGHLGLETYSRRWSVGVAWQPPLWQHLGNGFLRASGRVQVNASLLL